MSANVSPILPCEENEVVQIALTSLKEASLKNDFIPIVILDKTYKEDGFKYSNSTQKYSLSPYIENNRDYILETVQFDKKDEIYLQFEVKKGNGAAQFKRGYINAVGCGVTILSQMQTELAYFHKILLKISKKDIESGACIDFYANDNDFRLYNVPNIHCGRVMINAGGQCFCNRDITESELQEMVKNIRDNTYYNGKTITYYHKNKLFYLYANVPQADQTFKKFAEVLNKAFNNHGITQCSHKIHFLANMYVETMYYTATREGGKENSFRYDPYRGRGFQHLTWESNYKEYEKDTGVKVANDLTIAADTGAWYWKKTKINEYAEKDSIFDTSRLINIPGAKKTTQINGYEVGVKKVDADGTETLMNIIK